MIDTGILAAQAGRNMPSEADRLAALADLGVAEGGPEATFNRIARIGGAALRFPTAHITLITQDQRISKTSCTPVSVPREESICSVTIQGYEPLIIPDTQLDGRVSDLAVVTGETGLRSYWGMPLTTRHGYNLGAFCVFDAVPRHPLEADLDILRDLGRLTVECMELRAQAKVDVLTGAASRHVPSKWF